MQRAPGAVFVYAAIAFSGLTALGAEVVWTRLLSLLLGATVYTFSIILAVFLTGTVGRQRRRFFPGPPRARSTRGAGRLPDPAGPGDRLDRVHAGACAALVARRSVARRSIPGSISIWT